MSSANKVFIVGNLGRDPEVNKSGKAPVATLSIATSLSWKDKTTGEKREETEWHRVVVHGHIAEFAEKYLKKGHKVYVDGRLRTRKWTDNSGIDRYVTEIIARELLSLERADNSNRPPEPPPIEVEDVPF